MDDLCRAVISEIPPAGTNNSCFRDFTIRAPLDSSKSCSVFNGWTSWLCFQVWCDQVTNGLGGDTEPLLRPLWGRVMALSDYCPPAVCRCDGTLTADDNTAWCWGRTLLIPSSNLRLCWIFFFVFLIFSATGSVTRRWLIQRLLFSQRQMLFFCNTPN